MHTVAPPRVSAETIAAFFAAMRLWLLEALALLVALVSDRTPCGRAARAWLDADVREATADTRRMLFALAVSRMAPARVRRAVRGGARPGTAPVGFRPAPRSRNWLRLVTRDLKAPCGQRDLRGRLDLLRDLIARPDVWIARIAARFARLHRSRKGARFLCVAPPALVLHGRAPAAEPARADTS